MLRLNWSDFRVGSGESLKTCPVATRIGNDPSLQDAHHVDPLVQFPMRLCLMHRLSDARGGGTLESEDKVEGRHHLPLSAVRVHHLDDESLLLAVVGGAIQRFQYPGVFHQRRDLVQAEFSPDFDCRDHALDRDEPVPFGLVGKRIGVLEVS